MKRTAFTHRSIAVFVCATMLAAFLPHATMAGDTKEKVQVQIGKPSVWSLAQAHYLLASMHKKNAGIDLKAITSEALDPNTANATRLQILRTVLGIQAEFNQKVGVENQSKLREEQVQLKRRADAQIEVTAKEEELRAERMRLNGLKKQLVVLQETNRQRDEERSAQSDAESKRDTTGKITEQKFIPLTEEDESRKKEIVLLDQKVKTQQAKVDGLTAEVTALNTQANAAVTPASLTDTDLTDNTIALPTASTTTMQKVIDKAFAQQGTPSLAASIALDNYIGMQYEIIAKQLTLLRDEIGPDERVVFLELPSSIYTVPCKSEDYVVQVRWKVTKYYKDLAFELDEAGIDDDEHLPAGRYTSITKESNRWRDLNNDSVRAIDIIPRQSALNINDYHATVSQKNFLGVLKLLVGFGVKVDYQRQRELYEEFLQQEVFASGFGKGGQEFGWTFGPLPGTNRVAPGQRTTYAVLAVPNDASGLRLQAEAIAYKRTKTPADGFQKVPSQVIAEGNFRVKIPNEQTEGFSVQSIAYTPVLSGSPVTAVLGGDYFSPQINVFVENTPLTRVLNFGSKESAELKPGTTDSKIKGHFELVNSRQLLITFDMGNTDFVGTPNITLVTPEKTSSINFFKMRVNFRPGKRSLSESSVKEPMFMKPFALTALGVEADVDDFLKARLTGTGLRPGAEVWVNGKPFDSTDGENYDGKEEAVFAYINGENSGAAAGSSAPRPSEEALGKLRKSIAQKHMDQVCAKLDARANSQPANKDLSRCDEEIRNNLMAKRMADLEDIDVLYKAIKREELDNAREKSREALDAVIEKYRGYEKPRAKEYAKQESTGEYTIRFEKGDSATWKVRLRQRTVRGFDEDSLTQQFPPTPAASKRFEIRHYITNAGGENAEVDLRFFSTNPLIPDSVAREILREGEKVKNLRVKRVIGIKKIEIHRNEGTYPNDGCLSRSRTAYDRPCGQDPEDDERYRARFLVRPHIVGSHKLDRDTITVTVHKEVEIEYVDDPPKKGGNVSTPTDSGAPSKRPILRVLPEVMDIALPVRAQILKVSNSGTGKPSGFADQEVTAIIEGVNLDAIKKIFFGTQQAEIVGITDNDSAIVKVPKLANLPRGEAVTVPITVAMKSDFYEGKTVAAGYYKYVGQPLPLDVGEPVPVVVRPRYKGKEPGRQ